MESFLGEFQHLRIQLEDIKSATENFDNKRLIGVGGFGKVYKGELCHFKGRSMVAFKRLDRKFGQGDPEFWKEWFSLNKTGENCEMISAAECIFPKEYIPDEDNDPGYVSRKISRFPPGNCYKTGSWGFTGHVRTQFLSPHITYTVNLVFKDTDEVLVPTEQRYVCLRYKMKEEQTNSGGWMMADVREDGWMMAELFQFESEKRSVDLEIGFTPYFGEMKGWRSYVIEGIEFRPIEKLEHVMLDDNEDMHTISETDETYWENKLPNDYEKIIKWSEDDVKWTTKKELYFTLCKGFQMSSGQVWLSLDKNGKRCLMRPARYALIAKEWKWKSHAESRFKDVAYSPVHPFSIVCKINSGILSPETKYACYLVYKLEKSPEVLSNFEFVMQVRENFDRTTDWRLQDDNCRFIYIFNPQTPVIRPKAGENSHNPMNRPKLKGIPKQRNDGWMEVQVWEIQTGTTIEIISMRFGLGTGYYGYVTLSVQGIELRPE
ncbi:hypothetical protein M8C21_015878 [Ambrosia artemisiifolia]|uniref:Uncharacterized protein n=1 Tax=Ambrosia artemisiifolia TaxID=4212 RepID=A0AAD5D3Q9_AMBAR|nr:hypothetical protein M8C21_015878 [Ambrosia artemisiifolia]